MLDSDVAKKLQAKSVAARGVRKGIYERSIAHALRSKLNRKNIIRLIDNLLKLADQGNVQAATYLLDRVYGRATQAVSFSANINQTTKHKFEFTKLPDTELSNLVEMLERAQISIADPSENITEAQAQLTEPQPEKITVP